VAYWQTRRQWGKPGMVKARIFRVQVMSVSGEGVHLRGPKGGNYRIYWERLHEVHLRRMDAVTPLLERMLARVRRRS
jgi:hypothetical protein